MKISIVIAVLNSHKVVVRQIRHFKNMKLPRDIEIIFVDDGSDPPLNYQNSGLRNFYIYYTNDKRPWTQGLARNLGATNAKGEFILFTDIDHIISKEAIDAVRVFKEDKMVFPRQYGMLDKWGNVTQDRKALIHFGLTPARLNGRMGIHAGFHGNTYAIRRELFIKMGMYRQDLCQYMFHAGGKVCMSEDRDFNLRWGRWENRGKAKPVVVGPPIYFYPTGRYNIYGSNPFGLFHKLSLEQTPQPMLP